MFEHQVGGDPFQVHELFLSLAAISGFGFSMLVLLKARVRDWFTRLVLRNPQAEGVTKNQEPEGSSR